MLETALESALSKDEFTKKINGGIVARDELPDKVPIMLYNQHTTKDT